MTRASNSQQTRNRRKKVLNSAEGYFGSKSKLFKTAKEQLMNSSVYAFRDRKNRKRNFRRLWITRIGNSCQLLGLNYSTFMNSLKLLQIHIDRKQLSEMAIKNWSSFENLVMNVKEKKDFLSTFRNKADFSLTT